MGVKQNLYSKHPKRSWSDLALKGIAGGFFIILGAVVLLSVPILALFLLPFVVLKAIHHFLMSYTHRSFSKNEEGIPLCKEKDPITGQPIYMWNGVQFSEEDMIRLLQEKHRLIQWDRFLGSCKILRSLAKCLIPVVGVVWAIVTELNHQVAPFDSEEGWRNQAFWSAREAVRWHLHVLSLRLGRSGLNEEDVA